MRTRNVALLAAALMLGLLTADAMAQPGGRLRGRRLGGPRANNPGPNAANTNGAARPNRQLGQGLQNLGGKLQQAIDAGALESILGQAGAPVPQLPNADAGLKAASADMASRAELRAQFAGNEPFSPAWYADHPRAWQFTHPHADAWAVASIAAATAWVGIAPAASATAAEQVHTSDTLDPESANKTEPAGEFLPLGVFALGPAGAQDPSALLQLALSKQGEIAGNYFDVVTGTTSPVSGSLDKHTQLATFKIISPGAAEFEAALVSLTRPDGSIRLRFAGGEVSDWHLARFESQIVTPVPASTSAPVVPPQ